MRLSGFTLFSAPQPLLQLQLLPVLPPHLHTKHYQHRLGRQRGELRPYGESSGAPCPGLLVLPAQAMATTSPCTDPSWMDECQTRGHYPPLERCGFVPKEMSLKNPWWPCLSHYCNPGDSMLGALGETCRYRSPRGGGSSSHTHTA